ncbi:MAG: hypothetical protein ACREXY_08760, partial [Gammaproteobacteria bacterium]
NFSHADDLVIVDCIARSIERARIETYDPPHESLRITGIARSIERARIETGENYGSEIWFLFYRKGNRFQRFLSHSLYTHHTSSGD